MLLQNNIGTSLSSKYMVSWQCMQLRSRTLCCCPESFMTWNQTRVLRQIKAKHCFLQRCKHIPYRSTRDTLIETLLSSPYRDKVFLQVRVDYTSCSNGTIVLQRQAQGCMAKQCLLKHDQTNVRHYDRSAGVGHDRLCMQHVNSSLSTYCAMLPGC